MLDMLLFAIVVALLIAAFPRTDCSANSLR